MDTKQSPHNNKWLINKPPAMVRNCALLAFTIALLGVSLPGWALPPSTLVDPINEQLNEVKQLEGSPKKGAYADALFYLGNRYWNVGNLSAARESYEKTIAAAEAARMPELGLKARIHIANTYMIERKIDLALEKFDAASEFAAANKLDDANTIEADIGLSLMSIGKVNEAEEHYRKAIASVPSSRPVRKGMRTRDLAHHFANRGKFDEALSLQIEALKAFPLKDDDGVFVDDPVYAKAMAELADYQNRNGKPVEAYATLKQLRDKFPDEGPNHAEFQAQAEFGEGDLLYERQRIVEAKQHYEQAVKLSRGGNAPDEDLSKYLIGLGLTEIDLEHFSQAETLLKESLDLSIKSGNMSLAAEAEIQLANNYLTQGSPERALQHLNISLTKANNADMKKRADVLTSIGRCYAGLGQRQAAEKSYREAINVYTDIENIDHKALAINSLAVLYLDANDCEGFDKVYAEAKELYATQPAREQAKFEYNNAQSQVMRKHYQEAIGIYEGALAKAKSTDDDGLQSSILRGLGTCNLLSGNVEAALGYYKQALALSQDSGSIEAVWDCNLGVGKAHKALKQYKEAEPYLRKAVAMVEHERSNLTRDSFKTYNLDLRKDCFQELVDLLVSTDRAYESLEIAERGKARAFLDMLANKSTSRRIASNNLAPASVNIASATPAPAVEKPILVAMATPSDGTRSVSVQSKINAAEEAFEETAISPVNADPPTVDEIKSLIANRKSTCVEFLMTNTQLYTWVIHPDGSINMSPPITVPGDFRTKVRDLLTGMTQQAKTPAEVQANGMKRQTQLRALYDMLIKPIDQYLPKNKDDVVTILPHDVLFCIPFAALMSENGDYLAECHTLSYAPAIGVLRATQKLKIESESTPHKLLAFGNPITKRIAFLGALPYAEKEVKHIASLYPPASSQIEIGEAATKNRFAELAPTASEIHLATHGLVDEEHPMKSALVLAPTDTDDGVLSMRDILTLKNLKPKMVVLSACQTGRGKITGDGVASLSRAFIIAGAPSVMVSQWNVDDIMTDFQMEKFYRFYLKGTDRARALRDAQLATIRYMENIPDGQNTTVIHDAKVLRANPRYWAAFQLIGEI